MKDEVKVSVVQFNCAWMDREKNAQRMAELVEQEATEHGSELIAFPEMASTGYLPVEPDKDFTQKLFEQAEPVPGPSTELIGAVAKKHGAHVIFGVTQEHPTVPQALYNSSVLIGPDGEVIGVYQKVHPALDEKHFFMRGGSIPVYDTALGKIALNICYDVRFPELARSQALAGAEILVSVWAMYEQPGKAPNDSIIIRCRSRATENFFYVLGCNRSGEEGGRKYFGRSVIVGVSGDVLAVSDNDGEEILRATLTGKALREQRMYLPVFGDRRPDLYGRLVESI
jgi:predicted amidohydrolase